MYILISYIIEVLYRNNEKLSIAWASHNLLRVCWCLIHIISNFLLFADKCVPSLWACVFYLQYKNFEQNCKLINKQKRFSGFLSWIGSTTPKTTTSHVIHKNTHTHTPRTFCILLNENVSICTCQTQTHTILVIIMKWFSELQPPRHSAFYPKSFCFHFNLITFCFCEIGHQLTTKLRKTRWLRIR